MSPSMEKKLYRSIYSTRIKFAEQGGDAHKSKNTRDSMESIGEESQDTSLVTRRPTKTNQPQNPSDVDSCCD